MRSRLGQWFQQKKRLLIILLLTVLNIFLLVTLIGGYVFQWTLTGAMAQHTSPNTQAIKTLWGWMSLLIIPVILALVSFFFTRTKRKNEQIIAQQRFETKQVLAKQRAEAEQVLALANKQEAALQAYLDRMSERFLERRLCKSKSRDEVRNVARVRTLTMLYQLNMRRTFLRESGLVTVNQDTTIVTFSEDDLSNIDLRKIDLHHIDLSGANLRGANLRGANLKGANLRGVNLSRADLSGADLSRANLSGADLFVVDLSGADLSRANLSGANLSGAHLSRTHLFEADLNGADLSRADLSGADLSGAHLSGAYLWGADLSNAIIDQPSLDKVTVTQEQSVTLHIVKKRSKDNPFQRTIQTKNIQISSKNK